MTTVMTVGVFDSLEFLPFIGIKSGAIQGETEPPDKSKADGLKHINDRPGKTV